MNVAPRTLHAELRKTFATRGTWIAYALLVALTVGFSLFIASGSTTDAGALGGGDNDIVADALSGVAIGAIVAAVIGAIAIGNEYASGMIASTFAAQPRRSRVLVSKAILVGMCTTAVGVAAAFVAFFATRPLQRSNGFVAPGYPDPDLTSEPVLRAILGSGALVRPDRAACSRHRHGRQAHGDHDPDRDRARCSCPPCSSSTRTWPARCRAGARSPASRSSTPSTATTTTPHRGPGSPCSRRTHSSPWPSASP